MSGEKTAERKLTPEEALRINMRCEIADEFSEFSFDRLDVELVRGGGQQVDNARRACGALAPDGSARRITLSGPAGVGKTVLGTCCFVELVMGLPFGYVSKCHLDGEPARCLWLDASEVGLAAVRAQGKEADVVRQAMRAPVLMLDDIGSEAMHGPAAVAAIGQIIRSRHNQYGRSIYSVGLNKSELVTLYGSGIARRIFDRAVVIAWGWK